MQARPPTEYQGKYKRRETEGETVEGAGCVCVGHRVRWVSLGGQERKVPGRRWVLVLEVGVVVGGGADRDIRV